MNLVTALALVIGALAVLITWLMTGGGPLSMLSIWAAFIAWGSFFNQGGGENGLKNSLLAAIWGAICATIALVLANSGALGGLGGLALPVIVGATVALMVLGAHVPLFSAIPAAVYGYAATAAFALMGNHVGDALSMNIGTMPALNVIASMVVGGIFGYVSEKIASSLAAK
jgi:Protein of unknown function (DUF1097)